MGAFALRKSESLSELSHGHPLAYTGAALRSAGGVLPRHPEVPHDPNDRQDCAHVHQNHVDSHHPEPDDPLNSTTSPDFRGLKRRRRLALVTTVTELNAMAAPA